MDPDESLEERKFQADQEHQQAERAREDRKLTFGYHIKASVLGPFTAGALTFFGIVAVQSFQSRSSVSVEKRKFEGDVILNSLRAQNQKDAVANLRFALDIGLIPDYADQVRNKIQKDNGASVPFNPPPQVPQPQAQQPPKPDVVIAPSYKDAPDQYYWQIKSRSFSGFIPDGIPCRQYIARWNAAVFTPEDEIHECKPGAWRGKPPYQPIAYPDSGVFFEDGKPPRLVGRCEDAEHSWAMNESREAMFNPNYKPPHASRNPTCVPLRIQ